MNLTEKQKEQLTVALQAAVFAAFAGAALIQEEKLKKEKYRLKEKALKRKYRLKNKKKR